MNNRPVNIDLHNALVLATAPLLMVVPYLLTFSPGVGLLSFLLGAMLMGVALAGSTDQDRMPSSALAGFDWTLGFAIFGIGLASGLFGDQPVATIFLVGFGAAHLALAAVTRYGARGA
jgi:hypothetical protein